MSSLEGKTLIVTGASRGIGAALAVELARSGVNLVLNARHSSPLDEVVALCRDLGVEVRDVVGSAAEAETALCMMGAALSIGNFLGFIQVAGVLHPGPLIWELSDAHFKEVMDASVTASQQLMRFAVPELRKQGGGVAVFFGSGAAEINFPGMGAYCAAKAAEELLARQLAIEAPEITTFIYRPGVVETRMQKEARQAEGGASEEMRRKFIGYRDRGELISPEQAASALVHILKHSQHQFHGKVATWNDGS
jgi:NAD(P)-dependent dehydrogenase (short-subunit alcohol dehydrogenase family)